MANPAIHPEEPAAAPRPPVTYCVTCRNRLHQLRETLPGNLRVAGAAGHSVALVDYGSEDGLSGFVWDGFRDWIGRGTLRFFEVDRPAAWHAPRAKNLAHRIAPGGYLFNLDGDNHLTAADARMVAACAASGCIAWQFSGDYEDGSFGRIGLPADTFAALGGYDESFHPMGHQDTDLLARALASGRSLARLPATAAAPIRNTVGDKVAHLAGAASGESARRALWTRMNELNIADGTLRSTLEGPRRGAGFATFDGRLDGRRVRLDGRGGLWPLEPA